jgi:hypothetical protein
MTVAGSSRAAWRKSSYSGANGSCVEIASPAPDTVAVRDSRNPGGPQLAFPAGRWQAFTAALKQHAADLQVPA